MDRISNFYADNVIGKIGENDFKTNVYSILKKCLKRDFNENEQWFLHDVSGDSTAQSRDVDFILSTNQNYVDLSKEEKDKLFMHDYDDYIKIEVKTDTRIYETRNMVYELISHYKGGCGAVTAANYFYYVCVDSNNFNDIKERLLVDMRKLREYLIYNHHLMSHNPHDVPNPNIPLVMHRVDNKKRKDGTMDDPILNILCNVDNLINLGIIERL